MRMRRTFIVFAFLIAFTLPGIKDAAALNFGMLQVHPGLEFKTIYDDNVFAQDTGGRVDDWAFLISPGLLLQLKGSRNLIELEYRADIYRYVDTGNFNDVEDHNFRLGLDSKFSRLSITLSDLAKRGHETRSEENAAIINPTTVITPISKYWTNDLNAEVGYQLTSRFKLALGYQNFFINYDLAANSFRSRMDNAGLFTVYYRILPKTSLFVQGVYRDVDHTENTTLANSFDSREYWALGGVTWDITAKTTGSIKGGYEWKDFKDQTRKDYQSGVYLVSVEHRFTAKTSVLLEGTRQANETDDPNTNFYTTTNGRLTLRLSPVSKIQVAPFGAYASDIYSGESTVAGDTTRRKDRTWSTGIDLKYLMNKWITIAVGYQHSKRSSNLTFYDYTDNMGSISIKAVL